MRAHGQDERGVNGSELPVHLEDSRRRQTWRRSDEGPTPCNSSAGRGGTENTIADRPRDYARKQDAYSDECCACCNRALR